MDRDFASENPNGVVRRSPAQGQRSEMAVFELVLDIALVSYLVIPYIRKRFFGP